ncbi:hypothetical protein [Photobacterium rosenbergii]|uniref:Uncharacterized protein n=1 Tax=Photobacterium rosenbergii TaxID=294936 RepID=A0ABU3ZDQ2_9GAMM|nr:hypothetical protein [Photobacterium rosenbergii]MDV5168054.1 hypothetical protein [Photobacterium rosenbergii]
MIFEPSIESMQVVIALSAPEAWWPERMVEDINSQMPANGSVDAILSWHPEAEAIPETDVVSNINILLSNTPEDPASATKLLVTVKEKLIGHSMPNNVDIADFRTLQQMGKRLLGFYDLPELFSYLRECNESLVGGVILLDSQCLDEYRQTSNQISALFPGTAYLCFSTSPRAGSGLAAVIAIS